jgi:hypothetical protein
MAPCVPDSSPATRPVHRRVVGLYPGSVVGAKSGSLSWVRPLMGLTGRSVMGAAGGFEVVTGWNKSTICGAGPGSRGDRGGFTAAEITPAARIGGAATRLAAMKATSERSVAGVRLQL